jgi:hypothetical protein
LLAGVSVAAFLASATWPAAAQDTPTEILSAQLRLQGYRCDAPVTAERDDHLSRADEAVWIVRCVGTSFRMRLVPDMAARVEQLN